MGISVTRAAARLKTTESALAKADEQLKKASAEAAKFGTGMSVPEDVALSVKTHTAAVAFGNAVLSAQRAALERKTAEYPTKLRKHLERCRRGGIADSRRAAARAAK